MVVGNITLTKPYLYAFNDTSPFRIKNSDAWDPELMGKAFGRKHRHVSDVMALYKQTVKLVPTFEQPQRFITQCHAVVTQSLAGIVAMVRLDNLFRGSIQLDDKVLLERPDHIRKC